MTLIVAATTVTTGTALTSSADGDTILVANTVSLITTDAAHTVQIDHDNVDIRVDGTVAGQGVAIDALDQSGASITVGDGGVVQSFEPISGDAGVRLGNNGLLINHGDISASQAIGVLFNDNQGEALNTGTITGTTGVLLGLSFNEFGYQLINSGTITGTGNFDDNQTIFEGRGVLMEASESELINQADGLITSTARNGNAISLSDRNPNQSEVYVTNFGELSAINGTAVNFEFLGGDALSSFFNGGTVIGGDASYVGGNNEDDVTNLGTMVGDITLDRGADTLLNSGEVVGRISLGNGDDTYDGRGGRVTQDVQGGSGDDVYIVDDDSTLLVEAASEGTDEVRSKGNFALGDQFENLTLIGSADAKGTGNDRSNVIAGNSGDNRLAGQDRSDTISGGNGEDTLRGGSGDDELSGGNGDDLLQGGRANDEINGDNGDDTLRGGDGGDTLSGGNRDDLLHGGNGGDTLTGDDGNDTLYGGAGKDALTGGASADLFVFKSASDSRAGNQNRDVITDFDRGTDVIDLSTIDARTGSGNQAFTLIGETAFSGTKGELRYDRGTDETVIQADRDGDGVADFEIELTQRTRLDADDFIL